MFERFFAKRDLLNIKLEKPHDGAKFGLSFFDGGAAWSEIHRRLEVAPPAHLVLKSITANGLLQAYNNSVTSNEDRAMVADHLISVNGVKHSFEAMRDQLRESDSVDLVVHKYSLYFPFFVRKLNGRRISMG